MLFKFKSQAAADLIMLEADGRRLLKIMLGDDPDQGIIESANMPAVIAALASAVAQDEAARKQRAAQAQSGAEPGDEAQEPPMDPVRLSQRATPMLKLLARCVAEESDLVWGV